MTAVAAPASNPTGGSRSGARGSGKLEFLRTELCQLVAKLSSPSPSTIVPEALDLFFSTLPPAEELLADRPGKWPFPGDTSNCNNHNNINNKNNNHNNSEGLFPLMVACDKGNLECLLYFCEHTEEEAARLAPGRQNGPSSLASAARNRGRVLEELIGNPLASRTRVDRNTAFHHATTLDASARGEGPPPLLPKLPLPSFLELLERLAEAQGELRGDKGSGGPPSTKTNLVLAMGAAANAHNDTPLMMAVASNVYCPGQSALGGVSSSALRFLEEWYRLALDRSRSGDVDDNHNSNNHNNNSNNNNHRSKKGRNPDHTAGTGGESSALAAVRDVLRATNHSGESVLTLAWSGGVHEVVAFLVRIDDGPQAEDLPPIVGLEDVSRCRDCLSEMERRWRSILREHSKRQIKTKNASGEHPKAERYAEERRAIERCAGIMEAHVSARSERIAGELLSCLGRDPLPGTGGAGPTGGNPKKKKPKKARHKKRGDRKPPPPAENKDAAAPGAGADTTDATTDATKDATKDVLLTTLANGTVAVQVSGHSEADASSGESGNREDDRPGGGPSEACASRERSSPRESGPENSDGDSDSNPTVERSVADDANRHKKDGPWATPENGTVALRESGRGGEAGGEGDDQLTRMTARTTKTTTRPVTDNNPPHPVVYRRRTMSLDETNQMLRDRYKQGNSNHHTNNANHNRTPDLSAAPPVTEREDTRSSGALVATTAAGGGRTPSSGSDADAVLSALCLDVGCLLYSDHGMALNLSPAQLDAVQQILEEQLQSVRKARALQERRCKGAAAAAAP